MSKGYVQDSAEKTTEPATDSASGGVQGMGNAARQEQLKKRMGGGTHTVVRGDTLWGIAAHEYGDGGLWPKIRDANADRVKNGGDLIFVHSVLNIPVVGVGDAGGTSQASGGQSAAAGPQSRTTEFGVFDVYPDAYVGPLPLPHDGIQPVRMATFVAMGEDNAQNRLSNPSIDALDEDMCSSEAQTVTIGTELVQVHSKAEALHAARILRTIREEYGIDVNSQKGVDAIKASYTDVPESELDKLKTKEWEYKELVALSAALAHFAPILGARRTASSRNGKNQEVDSVSKVDQAIDQDSASGTLDTSTLGEYFRGSSNFSMFSAGTDSTVDFQDNSKQLEGTAIHELAHGLMRHEVRGYAKHLAYWRDRSTASGQAGAEAPITTYGQTNASEDLSEAVMYYFVDRPILANQCPIRHAYIHKIVSSWTPKTSGP